jgi:hypothetical protein
MKDQTVFIEETLNESALSEVIGGFVMPLSAPLIQYPSGSNDVEGKIPYVVLDRTSPELLVNGSSDGIQFCLMVVEPKVDD